jgi:hypothetical protein
VWVAERGREGGRRSAVAGFEHLAAGGCEEKKGGSLQLRAAARLESQIRSQIRRLSDFQIFRFSDFQYFLSTPASACTMQRPPSLSDFDAARLDSGVQTAPAGTDVKVFRQQASKQASKRAGERQAGKQESEAGHK